MRFFILEIITKLKTYGKQPTTITLPKDLYFSLKKELEETSLYKEGFLEMSIDGVRILFGSKVLVVECE